MVPEELFDIGKVCYARCNEEALATTVVLAQQRLAQYHRIPRHDIGAHRQPVDRRGLNDRKLAQARHCHLQGSRDRRCGQRKHVNVGLERFQPLFVDDAEALLLIDDNQAKPLKRHALGKEGMRPHNDVDRSVGKPFAHRF